MDNQNSIDTDQPMKSGDARVSGGEKDYLLTRFFNWLGDLFAKMVGGVVHFVPRVFRTIVRWLISEKLRKLIVAIAYAVLWMIIWLVVVFGVYTWMEYEKVLRWIMALGAYVRENFAWVIALLRANFKQIWTVFALMGSVYGLIFGSVKWWRRRKAKKATNELQEAEKTN